MSEKSSQPWEENRALKARLTTVEGRLAAVEAQNDQLLQEKRDLAERLAKGKELVSALVATVPELAFLSDAGQSAVGGGGSSAHSSTGSCLGASQQEPAAEPAGQREPATVAVATPPAAAQETLPVGLLFPGWSNLYVGMMSSVKDIPAVRDMLEKAEAILGFDVLKLCLEGPADELAFAGEVILYIANLAGLEKLRLERQEAVRRTQVVAGLGVGECTALVAAGVLSFEDGLELVKLRWYSIVEVSMTSKQASAVVAGLHKPKLAELCTAAARRGGSGATCQISGELSSLSFVVGGTEKSVLALTDLAAKAGAVQARVLPVPHAHNTPLLEPVGQKMSALLDKLLPKMNPPKTSVYMAATAAPVRPGTDPKDVAEVLKKEVTSSALWGPSVKAMIGEGVSEFYEVGPGESLRNHMRHIDPKLWRTMTNVHV